MAVTISATEMTAIAMCSKPTIHVNKDRLVFVSELGFRYGNPWGDNLKHYDVKWTNDGLVVNQFNDAIIRKKKIIGINGTEYAELTPSTSWNIYDPSDTTPLTSPVLRGDEIWQLIKLMASLGDVNKDSGVTLRICTTCFIININDREIFVDRFHLNRMPLRRSFKPEYFIKPIYGQLGYAIGKEETFKLDKYKAAISSAKVYGYNLPPVSNLRGMWRGTLAAWIILGVFALDSQEMKEMYFTNDTIAARGSTRVIYSKEV